MHVGLLIRTLTARYARGRPHPRAGYRVCVRMKGFACEKSGLRASRSDAWVRRECLLRVGPLTRLGFFKCEHSPLRMRRWSSTVLEQCGGPGRGCCELMDRACLNPSGVLPDVMCSQQLWHLPVHVQVTEE